MIAPVQISCRADSLVIGSRLDSDIHSATCRLAFSGKVQLHTNTSDYKTVFLPQIKIHKPKVRTGVADMMHDEYVPRAFGPGRVDLRFVNEPLGNRSDAAQTASQVYCHWTDTVQQGDGLGQVSEPEGAVVNWGGGCD